MNKSLILGSFVTGIVTALPWKKQLGEIRFRRDGQWWVASFKFADGRKVIPGREVPELDDGNCNHRYVRLYEEIVAFVDLVQGMGVSAVQWGHAGEYREMVAMITKMKESLHDNEIPFPVPSKSSPALPLSVHKSEGPRKQRLDRRGPLLSSTKVG